MEKTIDYAAARRRTNISNLILDIIIYLVLAFVVIVTVYPFWNTIAISLNDGLDSLKGGIKLWPRKFTWKNYADLFQTDRIFNAGIISVTRTVFQTVLSVFCTSLLAYALSRKEFVLRKYLTTIIVISMYVNGYEDFVESTSIKNIDKLIIPLHALAFIFSSQVFFCDIAKLIHSYYDKFLSYKIIPIYIKEDEEYRKKINTRKTIWKQFESPYFYYKNEKNLYNEDNIINEKKVQIYSEKIGENIKSVYNNFAKNIIEQHKNLNEFDRNDKKITLFNKNISAPSSLYNQISKDELFKLKLNLYKYKIREFKIKKRKMINDSKYYKNDFNNIVKNKVFKQSVFYMNPIDVVQDFLNDND